METIKKLCFVSAATAVASLTLAVVNDIYDNYGDTVKTNASKVFHGLKEGFIVAVDAVKTKFKE